jgi:hypothetical protein
LTFYPSDFPTLLAAGEQKFGQEEGKTIACVYLPLFCHINVLTEICAVLKY